MNPQSEIYSIITNQKDFLAQQIILSKDGIVLDIGNALFFDIPIFEGNPLFPLFFESVFHALLDIELGDEEVFFPRIFSENGYFDFRFCKMIYQNEIAIVWSISNSPNIENLFKLQQKANELLFKEK